MDYYSFLSPAEGRRLSLNSRGFLCVLQISLSDIDVIDVYYWSTGAIGAVRVLVYRLG